MRVAAGLRLPSVEGAAVWAFATLAIIVALAIFLVGYDALAANLAKLSLATFALCLVLMKPGPVFALLNATYAILGRGRKLVLWLRRAVRNTSTLSQPRVFLPGLAVGAVGWLAAPAVLTLALAQMGVGLSFLHATAIYAAGALVGGATMLPGGGGGTEAVLISLLALSDVPIDAAFAALVFTLVTVLR